jgi:hypothetical protein
MLDYLALMAPGLSAPGREGFPTLQSYLHPTLLDGLLISLYTTYNGIPLYMIISLKRYARPLGIVYTTR